MAALTDNRNTPKMLSPYDMIHERVGIDSTTFYAGALIMYDQSDGKFRPAGGTSQSDGICVGRCLRKVVTGASNTLTVQAESGLFKYVNGDAIVAADVGKACFADDDQTVFLAQGTTRSRVGTIYQVDSDGVWVLIPFPVLS